ncbi:MAG: hypothetical protein JW829_03585 [Pirellulales bacterium]|nr:hypothetical protein [Pirellulales bacterium]
MIETPKPVASSERFLATIAVTDRGQMVWEHIEAWLARMGDRLNPILVKETRQAIKSRQFTLTFVLVLAAVWITTFAGIAIMGPSIYYSASGPGMFWAYYWILAFPLAVVVPYGAYRSLAAEREDNTYELLSISTLTPRQIIWGKLASAFVQLLVYLSAVAPCLAFTYLLRGMDILSIALLLAYTVLGSMGLSVIGLLLATATKERYGQVLLSVLFVLALFGVFIGAVQLAYFFIEEGYQILGDFEFWIVNLAILTAYGTTFGIVFLAATAQITFTSDNRSTPLRIAMLIQMACFIGWMAYACFYVVQESTRRGNRIAPVEEIVLTASIVCGVYWFIMGTMMTAESPVLSRRVQRGLPRSYLGRLFLTWFNPGPGTGYVFAIANLTSVILMGFIILTVVPSWYTISTFNAVSFDQIFYFHIIGIGYVTLYLGIGKYLISLIRHFAAVPIAAAVLLQAFLVALGCLVPLMIQITFYPPGYRGYSLLHASNLFWSLAEIVDRGTLPQEAYTLVLLIPSLALLVFFLNFRAIAREVRHERIELPARIVEEEAAMRPPAAPQPQSPWDNTG